VWRYGRQHLTARVTIDMVLAGFGLFAVLGGFSVDRLGLERLGAGREGARLSVLAMGLVEVVSLAAVACGTAGVLLVSGSSVPGLMPWPWAIGVPSGSALALGAFLYAPRGLESWGPRWLTLAAYGQLLAHTLRELIGTPAAWCGIGLYFGADIASLYGAARSVNLRLSGGAVLIAYASGYLFTRRTLPLASAVFVELLLTCSLFWVGAPLAQALAAVIVYRTLGLPMFGGGGLVARTLLSPLVLPSKRDAPS
jgi:hypothetical protein